jgi:hypothetical protein
MSATRAQQRTISKKKKKKKKNSTQNNATDQNVAARYLFRRRAIRTHTSRQFTHNSKAASLRESMFVELRPTSRENFVAARP